MSVEISSSCGYFETTHLLEKIRVSRIGIPSVSHFGIEKEKGGWVVGRRRRRMRKLGDEGKRREPRESQSDTFENSMSRESFALFFIKNQTVPTVFNIYTLLFEACVS